jgi:hypothetical protein
MLKVIVLTRTKIERGSRSRPMPQQNPENKKQQGECQDHQCWPSLPPLSVGEFVKPRQAPCERLGRRSLPIVETK